MKFRWKSTALVLVPLLAIAMAGCSVNKNSAPAKATTLSVATITTPGNPAGDTYRAVFKAFTAKTGIKIDLEPTPTDAGAATTALRSEYAAGKEPDLLLTNANGDQLDYQKEGITINAKKYLSAWSIGDRILPDAVTEFMTTGVLLGFPYEGYQWPVWYNMGLMNQAGIDKVPTTSNELLADAKSLRAAGIQPFAVGGNDWTGQKLFQQFGQAYLTHGQFVKISENGGWCASPDAMKGIEIFVKLRTAGLFVDNAQGYNSDSMTSQFMTGKAAMMSAGSWTLSETTQASKDLVANIEFGGVPMPSGSTFDKPTAYQGASNGWWITRNGSKKLDAIKSLMKYMYLPSTIEKFNNDADMIMAVKASPNAKQSDTNPLAGTISKLPNIVDYATISDAYIPGAVSNDFVRATSIAYDPSKSATDICAALDAPYKQ